MKISDLFVALDVVLLCIAVIFNIEVMCYGMVLLNVLWGVGVVALMCLEEDERRRQRNVRD